jgi:hypothetical protein
VKPVTSIVVNVRNARYSAEWRTGGIYLAGHSHLMPSEEVVIGHYLDPDFGVLELTETRFEAAVNGRPQAPFVLRQWIGKQRELDVALSICTGEDPPVVADNVRADFRSVMSNVQGFKHRIAQSEMERARDWIVEAGMNLTLDVSTFEGLLKIEGFTIGSERLTVWLKETASIFGGHSIEVRIEMGEIIEICLSG